MQITNIEIKQFRSISSLKLKINSNNLICGPNSCGKSNILRALKFAFLPAFSSEKMAYNVSNNAISPNSAAVITIKFDKPTANLASALQFPVNEPFEYKISAKRNGGVKYFLNKSTITPEYRAQILEHILVVHVPPIRDLAAGGLDPFKSTLASVIRKTRGSDSLAKLNTRFKDSIQKSGKAILAIPQNATKNSLGVEELSVDVDEIDLESLLPQAKIKFLAQGKESNLDKLGTGHQSSVILSLYRQIGSATGKFVLYLFEEPDNHLHPTSLRAVSEDLKKCASKDTQSFITTHSPYFINQFPITDLIALQNLPDRYTAVRKSNITFKDRDFRVALGRFGFKPAEALLSRKVLVVEGANDVTLVRMLIELHTNQSPDQQDVLVIDAGGKDSVSSLCQLLEQIGATWLAIFDWDATEDTRQPIFNPNLNSQTVSNLTQALSLITSNMYSNGPKKSKPLKSINNLIDELKSAKVKFKYDFLHSVIGKFITNTGSLNAADLSKLKVDIRQKRIRKIRSALKKPKIWLWSKSPEEILLPSANAEALVQGYLSQKSLIKRGTNQIVERMELINFLHNLGHEPKIMTEIIQLLWENGHLNKAEIKEAIKTWLE